MFIETKNIMSREEGIALVESKGYTFQCINDRYSRFYLQFLSPEGIPTLLSKWDIENGNFWSVGGVQSPPIKVSNL